MVIKQLYSFSQRLEDPNHPLLGPNIKALNLCGLWPSNSSRIRTLIYNLVHFSTIIFVNTQIVELYSLRNDLNLALSNFSLTALSLVAAAKCVSMILCHSSWFELANLMSKEEVLEISKKNKRTLKAMQKYTQYARLITYFFWMLVILTNIALLLAPFMKFVLTATYRESIKQGIEPYPQIVSSWFPFDYSRMPGYLFASVIQIAMSIQGAAVIATYDTVTVTIMTFLKGQLCLLRTKCTEIFEYEANECSHQFVTRIIECHRHHNFILRQYKLFHNLLSPVMFVYILVCSVTICCSVVQLTANDIATYQKLWVIQYTIGQIFQLLLFCWHANEVYLESSDVDRGIFISDWWKADVRVRRQILLLAGKLNNPLALSAGPFSKLSVPTFISIMKGSYSFFTLLSQFQESEV